VLLVRPHSLRRFLRVHGASLARPDDACDARSGVFNESLRLPYAGEANAYRSFRSEVYRDLGMGDLINMVITVVAFAAVFALITGFERL
jgi:hypothetical protein